MKTLELDLKKKVYIVDTTAPIEAIEIDGYEYKCKGSELTEEIASELVDYRQNMYNGGFIFENYKDDIPKKLTAIKSFISAVESKKKFWLENPIEKPINYDLWTKYGDFTQYGKILTEKCLKWKEAEEKTFKNPLIFVKK